MLSVFNIVKLEERTFFITLEIIDRFFYAYQTKGMSIQAEILQLIALGAILIAVKLEEHKPITIA